MSAQFTDAEIEAAKLQIQVLEKLGRPVGERLRAIATSGSAETRPMDLTEFLVARIGEDEAWIRGDGGEYLDDCQECAFGQQPQSAYSQARLLVECEAKRRIVAPWLSGQDEDDWRYGIHSAAHEHILLLLAMPYAFHPDYDPAWALEVSASH